MATARAQHASNDATVGLESFLGSKEQSSDQDRTSAAALQQFFTLSIAAGIYNLGVLLEILHVANYDAEKACRIVDLIKGSPPTEPAIIATSQSNFDHRQTTGNTGAAGQSYVQNSDCAVQAFGNGYVASAAAASPYSAAVVSCAPGSAGVGVGTSAGTTTSTAVPLSAVTSLPQNCNINLDFSQPDCLRCSTSPKRTDEVPKSTSTQIPVSTRAAPSTSHSQEPQYAPAVQAAPPAQNRQTLWKKPGTAAPTSTSTPKALPNRPVPRNLAEDMSSARQPSHIPSTTNNMNGQQTMSTPVLDEMDPLKVSKLQEIIDILKS